MRLLLPLSFLLILSHTASAEMVFDTVLASVDDKPITLSDLSSRLGGKKVTLDTIRSNQEVRAALDAMVIDKVITVEAEEHGMQASPPEIDGYIDQVASQNHMTRAQFEEEIKKAGKSMDSYRAEVATEVLKGKLLSSELRRSIVITDNEAKALIRKAKGPTPFSTRTITLRSLLVSPENRSPEEFRERVALVQKKIEEDGFEDAVEEYSDDTASKESGGAIGSFAETDLEPIVFQAVAYLEEGKTSEPVTGSRGVRFFYVEKRSNPPEEETYSVEDLTQAKEFLRQRRMQERMGVYVTNDLMHKHTVEKKF